MGTRLTFVAWTTGNFKDLQTGISPLHDPVTWYKITHTGEQVAQWDFQNKGRYIVLEVPLRNLLTSMCDFVPGDRVVQRVYIWSNEKPPDFTTNRLPVTVVLSNLGRYARNVKISKRQRLRLFVVSTINKMQLIYCL